MTVPTANQVISATASAVPSAASVNRRFHEPRRNQAVNKRESGNDSQDLIFGHAGQQNLETMNRWR